MAIGMAESVVPSVRVDVAMTSGGSDPVNAVLVSLSAEAPVGVQKILPRQPVAETTQAKPKMASAILEKTESGAAVKNTPVRMVEEYKHPAPESRDYGSGNIGNKILESSEPKAVESPPAAVNLAARSTPIRRPLGNDAGIAADISIPVIAGRSLGLTSIKPIDRRRLIYGTSARNADKVYFPKQFSQAVGTLNAKAGMTPQLSATPQIVSRGNGDTSNSAPDRRQTETAGVSYQQLSQNTTEPGNQEPLPNGGYLEYETDFEQYAVTNVVTMADEEAMISITAVPDESKAAPTVSEDLSTGIHSSGQQSEDDNVL